MYASCEFFRRFCRAAKTSDKDVYIALPRLDSDDDDYDGDADVIQS